MLYKSSPIILFSACGRFMTIEHLFEFLLLFSILLHVLPERKHFGHIFYLNPNSRTFHEISGENIKFKVISRFFTHFSNSRLFPGYPGISGGRGNPDACVFHFHQLTFSCLSVSRYVSYFCLADATLTSSWFVIGTLKILPVSLTKSQMILCATRL